MSLHDDAFDELASAYLDDEVSVEERAIVDGDPELLSVVANFRGRRANLLSAPDFDGVDDDLIASAMSHFELSELSELSDIADPTTPDPAPRSLSVVTATPPSPSTSAPAATPYAVVRRIDEARRRRTRTVYGWLGAAAAVGVLAVGVGALSQGGNDSSTEESAGQAAATDAPVAAATEMMSAESAAPAAAFDDADQTAAPAAEAVINEILGPGEATLSDAPSETLASTQDSARTTGEPDVGGGSTGSAAEIPIAESTQDLAAIANSQVSKGLVTAGEIAGEADRGLVSCPDLGAVTVGELLWQGQQAFLLIRPTEGVPIEALAVGTKCELYATARLGP